MKRKVVMRLLCVSIASAMLVSNTGILVASDGTHTAIYNGQQMTVTVNGEQVILPNGQIVPLKDCKILDENQGQQTPDAGTPEGGDSTQTTPENPDGGTTTPETPDTGTTIPETPDGGTTTPENPDGGTTTPENPDGGITTPDGSDTGQTPDAGTIDSSQTEAPTVPSEQKDKEETSKETSTIALPGKSLSGSVNKSLPLSVDTPSLKAGIGFYVDELKDTYHLEFSDDFSETVTDIESEYAEAVVKEAVEAEAAREKAKEEQNKAESAQENAEEAAPENAEEAAPEAVSKVQVAEDVILEDIKAEDLTVSVRNWQDVLAVYLLEQSRAGVTEFKLDESAKTRLAQLVYDMNTPMVTSEELVCEPQYIADYMEANKETLTDEEKEFLSEYTSSNFMLLCSAATGAEGFIEESLGEDITAERAQVVAAAYSLVGKIPYFWGGKSSVVGWDDRWNSAAEVTAAGTSSSGTIQNYGLDCSGFVTWSFVNGYENSGATSLVGHGTATQWAMSEEITEEEAQPGDLVFLQQPNAAGINHVGIVVGRNDDGSLIAVHCNAGKNGVTVDSAYQVGFRYVRRPLTYVDDETQPLTAKQEKLVELKEKIAEENKTSLKSSIGNVKSAGKDEPMSVS